MTSNLETSEMNNEMASYSKTSEMNNEMASHSKTSEINNGMASNSKTSEMNNEIVSNSKTSELNNDEPSTSDKVPLEGFDSDGIDYSSHFNISVIFTTDSEAIDWAKRNAIKIGFELVIASHKKEGRQKLLRCSRGVRYRGVLRNLNAAVRRKRKTKACKCKFQIRVQQLHDSRSWVIRTLPGSRGMHNHALTVYPEGYRQMSGLSSASKKIVRDMTLAKAKPCAILTALQEKNLEDNPTREHVYNYREYLRRVGLEGKDVVGQFFHLAVENKYVHWTLSDPDTDVMTHIFMAHPESVNLLRTYYWFIGMNSTYKTNKCKMPFFEIVGMSPCNQIFTIAYAIMKDESESSYRWVLDKLRNLIGFDMHPTVIVTDRELGMMGPVREIFSQTTHLLCTWHINKDVEDKVYKICGKDKDIAEEFNNDKWKNITEAPTEAEYEKAVWRMKDDMKHFPQAVSYVEETWLVHKEMFVAAWTNNVLHFGNTTTCRAGREHVKLKQWLNSSTVALDTVWKNVMKEIDSQQTQIRNALEESARSLGLRYYGFPFNYLTCHVTHYCLRLLADELVRMRRLGDEVYDHCGCVLRTTHQIPCACELRTATNSEMPISVERLHPFWRTLVISGQVDKSDSISLDDASEDHRYFRSLVDEVNASDPAVVRMISILIHNQLYPDQASTIKGRPEATSTKPNSSRQ